MRFERGRGGNEQGFELVEVSVEGRGSRLVGLGTGLVIYRTTTTTPTSNNSHKYRLDTVIIDDINGIRLD